ncbi:MAG TPA: hypothetical protein VK601_24445 [Kofleriaceae bacterium]|nr:hypothetical protein [Kofleriaceae bacterium]
MKPDGAQIGAERALHVRAQRRLERSAATGDRARDHRIGVGLERLRPPPRLRVDQRVAARRAARQRIARRIRGFAELARDARQPADIRAETAAARRDTRRELVEPALCVRDVRAPIGPGRVLAGAVPDRQRHLARQPMSATGGDRIEPVARAPAVAFGGVQPARHRRCIPGIQRSIRGTPRSIGAPSVMSRAAVFLSAQSTRAA